MVNRHQNRHQPRASGRPVGYSRADDRFVEHSNYRLHEPPQNVTPAAGGRSVHQSSEEQQCVAVWGGGTPASPRGGDDGAGNGQGRGSYASERARSGERAVDEVVVGEGAGSSAAERGCASVAIIIEIYDAAVITRRQRPCCRAGAEQERSCGRKARLGQNAAISADQAGRFHALQCGGGFSLTR